MSTAVITERAVLGLGLAEPDSRMLIAGYGANLETAEPGLWCLDANDNASLPETMSSANVLAAAAQHLNAAGVTRVIPFKPSSAFERAARDAGYSVLAAPARSARQIENKLQLPQIAAAAGVACPETLVISRREIDAGAIELPDLSSGWVLQPAMGFAGAGTAPVASRDQLVYLLHDPAAPRADLWKLTRLVVGDPLTVNGVVIGLDEVVVAHVARQLTGIADCSGEPLGSCGNEWSIPVEQSMHAAVRRAAHAVGCELARRGYQGAFGIDVVATASGEVVLIEINPRITASFGMLNQLQRAHGFVPLIDVHESAFLDDVDAHRMRALARECYGGADGELAPWSVAAASIVCYNTTPHAVVAAADAPQLLCAGVMQQAMSLDQAQLGPNDALVIPQSSRRSVAPGAELVRIYAAQQVAADSGCRALTLDAARLVRDVRSMLDLQRSPAPDR